MKQNRLKLIVHIFPKRKNTISPYSSHFLSIHSLSQLSQKFFKSKSHLALVPAKSSSPPVHHLWTAIPPLATTSPHHLRHRTPRQGAQPFWVPPWHRFWWNLAGLPNTGRREFGALAAFRSQRIVFDSVFVVVTVCSCYGGGWCWGLSSCEN